MRKSLALLSPLVALLAALGITAPGAPATAVAQEMPAQQVTIAMFDYGFDPSQVVVPANTPIQIVLPNQGAERHRFNVGGFGDRWRSDDPNPGDTTTLEVTFTQPGVYEIWCSVATPDGKPHRDLGMEGMLTVTDAM